MASQSSSGHVEPGMTFLVRAQIYCACEVGNSPCTRGYSSREILPGSDSELVPRDGRMVKLSLGGRVPSSKPTWRPQLRAAATTVTVDSAFTNCAYQTSLAASYTITTSSCPRPFWNQ